MISIGQIVFGLSELKETRATPSTLAQSKERKGSNFAIWQPCCEALLTWSAASVGEQAPYDLLPGIEGPLRECPGRVEALAPLDPVGARGLQLGVQRVHENGRVEPVWQVLGT